MDVMNGAGTLDIRPLAGDEEGAWCAHVMSTSEPWITLGRGYDESLRAVTHPDREVYLARVEGAPGGFLILDLKGALVGYLRTLCVAPEARGRGLGTRLVAFAEERIFRERPK
jgi:ribosomal protein S18 acetylase RimI-like enzyme